MKTIFSKSNESWLLKKICRIIRSKHGLKDLPEQFDQL